MENLIYSTHCTYWQLHCFRHKKLTLLLWGSGPHLIRGSLGLPKSAPQTAPRSVQPFLQGSWMWPTDSQYLAVHWAPVSETASRQHLRLAASHQPTVPPHRQITHGGQAFAIAGPSTWNSLSKRLRDPSFNISVFDRLLKTFLFSQ